MIKKNNFLQADEVIHNNFLKYPELQLACGIIAQAVEDYKFLRKEKLESIKEYDWGCSLNELERFFNGKWCTKILNTIGFDFDGKELLRKVTANI